MVTTTITRWPAVSYDRWAATCDTLHAHTQVLGKLAVALAPPEPELHHAALRLTARGWETEALPAPDGSGALVVALDLRVHEVLVEHTSGATEQIPLTPNRAVGDVTRDVLAGIARVAGPVFINVVPQETPWSVPLDGDHVHTTYDTDEVGAYFVAATHAAHVLTDFRAPFRGRATAVAAWGARSISRSTCSPAGPSTRSPTTSSPATRPMRSRSRSGGGPAIPGTPGRPSTGSRSLRRTGCPPPSCHRPPPASTPIWASSSWTGTTCVPQRIPMATRSCSLDRCSATPAPWQDGMSS